MYHRSINRPPNLIHGDLRVLGRILTSSAEIEINQKPWFPCGKSEMSKTKHVCTCRNENGRCECALGFGDVAVDSRKKNSARKKGTLFTGIITFYNGNNDLLHSYARDENIGFYC